MSKRYEAARQSYDRLLADVARLAALEATESTVSKDVISVVTQLGLQGTHPWPWIPASQPE